MFRAIEGAGYEIASAPRRVLAVCMFTFFGLVLGVLGAWLWPAPLGCVLLIVSLVVDAVDGTIARRWDAAGPFGAALDYCGDVTIAGLLLGRLLAGPDSWLVGLSALFVLVSQIVHQLTGKRVSGRAAVTAEVLGVAVFS